MRHLLIGMLTLSLSGCAALTYTEPQTGSRARVRFVTDTASPSVLKVYDGDDCSGAEHEWMRLRVGALLRGSVKRLGMPLWNYHDNAAKEVYVSNDKPLYAMFWGNEIEGSIHYQCGVPLKIQFQENKDYEVRYRWNRSQCTVIFSEILKNDAGEHFAQEKEIFNNKTTAKDSGCQKQFTRLRFD
ncbi:MAG: hypothetical protein PHI64_12050 [Zoogloea sp.]|uniref:hypothetical protein n=1 Tax=Zoogloea sp. TaxID=49181 RepID=UPI002638ACB0|nr:hypothetical protein [Zoogloea sp.]MDD2989679.1 hypothetical protein [Zoogloea sp.]